MAPPRKPIVERLLARRDFAGDCWIYSGPLDQDGYGLIGIGRQGSRRVPRVAFDLWVRPLGRDELVLHHCDTPACFNPEHLYAGNAQDNAADRTERGRGAPQHGEYHPSCKLTDTKVLAIRAERARGDKLTDIAARYGIHFGQVWTIVKRRSWKHLP